MSSEINNRNLFDWIVIKMMFWQGYLWEYPYMQYLYVLDYKKH